MPTEREREGVGLKAFLEAILVAAIVGLIVYQQTKLSDLAGDVRVLQEQMGTPKPKEVDLLSNGVTCAPGDADTTVEQTSDGTWRVSANLQGSLSAAEAYCDLTGADLTDFEKNDDNSVNLAGSTLLITVRSDSDFSGDPNHPNGIQLFVKNVSGEHPPGDWKNASSFWIRDSGSPVAFHIADSNISQKVAAVSIRFVIGSDSTHSYSGGFLIKAMRLRKRGEKQDA